MVSDTNAISRAQILIVDDDTQSRGTLERLLSEAGYAALRSTWDSSQVVGLCSRVPPDLIVLNLDVTEPDGLEVMRLLRPWLEGRWFPILAISGDDGARIEEALSEGAKDFVTRPFDRTEVLLRIRNLLEMRYAQLELRKRNLLLEQEIDAHTQDLHEARLDVLRRLARAAEYRDDDGGQHPQRIGRTSAEIARELGLGRETVELIRHAAPLHDVGKIGVPESILLKRGRLTSEETSVMESHVEIGHSILAGSSSPLLGMAEQIVLAHHERWDGKGYPRGLHGEQVPLAARVVAVADTFDALAHARPYREALTLEESVAEIRSLAGSQFDPQVVRAFERLDHAALLARFESAGASSGPAVRG